MQFKDYKPQLACAIERDKIGKLASYSMECKYDGIRCIAIKNMIGNVTMYSRTGHELHQKLPNIVYQLEKIPGSYVLDGELGYLANEYTIDFNNTTRVLGSSPATAIQKQEVNISMGMSPIKFIVFDILHRDDRPIMSSPQGSRREELYHFFDLFSVTDLPDIVMAAAYAYWDATIYDKILAHNGEGVILKNPTAPYYPGKRRANTWYKIKGFDSVDCKIIGFDEGKGKYTGQVGALVVTDPTEQEIRVSGMTDTARQDMTIWFDQKYKGKMCEVKYFGKVGADGSGYRHPQFLRMRPDLDT